MTQPKMNTSLLMSVYCLFGFFFFTWNAFCAPVSAKPPPDKEAAPQGPEPPLPKEDEPCSPAARPPCPSLLPDKCGPAPWTTAYLWANGGSEWAKEPRRASRCLCCYRLSAVPWQVWSLASWGFCFLFKMCGTMEYVRVVQGVAGSVRWQEKWVWLTWGRVGPNLPLT